MRASPADTIAAISTALGPGAIAIVRLSGDHAIQIAQSVFEGASLTESASHTVHYGRVVDADGREVDEVLATVMRSPKSYTTEDMVEFACHGGSLPARAVLETVLAAGARLARPGEFTERAFLAGRLDLVQAEAVADIVAAKTRRGLAAALGQLEGWLSTELSALRESLLDLRAEVEALIDFADEDVGGGTRGTVVALARDACARADRLLENAEVGVAVRDGMSAAIVGKPNVGKSSVMNALLMRERSIVTALPGTTRDAIEDFVDISGIAVTLIDTAGWREAADEAEEAGVRRARLAARGADLVLLVVDAARGVDEFDRAIASELAGARKVVVGNKIDLGRACSEGELAELGGRTGGGSGGVAVAWVSALTGEGLDGLRGLIVQGALGAGFDEAALVSNVRHVDALARCRSAVRRALELLGREGPPELVAVEVGEAAAALGELTGETTPEDVLRRIFERFCVGK